MLVDAVAQNRLAVIVLGAGAVLRGLVFFAYDPFLWVPTSSGYIAAAEVVRPSEAHPWGYSGFLWLTGHGLSYREIVLAQHLLLLAGRQRRRPAKHPSPGVGTNLCRVPLLGGVVTRKS